MISVSTTTRGFTVCILEFFHKTLILAFWHTLSSKKLHFFADFSAQCNTYIVWGANAELYTVCTLLYLFETLHNWMRSRISHSAMEAKLK